MANLQTSVVKHISRAIADGMGRGDAMELQQHLMGIMERHADDWIGTYGVGKRGEFGVGRDSTQLSTVMKVDSTGRGDGNTFQAGGVPEQFGPIMIQRFNETDKMVLQIVNEFKTAYAKTFTFRGTRYAMTPDLVPLAADGVRDWVNRSVNDKWFKPLALLSPAWAVRVSMSEFFLNVFRQGGFRRLAATWADGAAKGDMKMLDYVNKVARGNATAEEKAALGHDTASFVMSWFKKERLAAPPPKEFTVLTAFVNTLRVGFDRGVVQALGQRDLLDAAVTSIYMFDGHLGPYGVLSTHGGDYDEMGHSPDVYGMLQKAANEAKPIQSSVIDRKVVLQREFGTYKNTAPEFIGMRHLRARWMSRTQWFPQIFDSYLHAFDESHDVEAAYRAAHAKARELIDEYPHKKEAYRARSDVIATQTNGLIVHNPDDALDNWAQWLGRVAEGHILGPKMPEAEAMGHGLLQTDLSRHEGLVDSGDANEPYRYVDLRSARMIRDGDVPETAREFDKQVHGSFSPTIFNETVGPHTKDWSTAESRMARGTTWVHTHILGKIVNGLSRNPTYIVDFANERKILSAYVSDGRMSQAEADVLAAQRATEKTVSYIHNPHDKTMWDQHLRVIAPFFFAQMQAFRRAGRLALENPGAFEQYIKILLGMNRGIQSVTKNGVAFITVPFGMWGLPFQVSLNSAASMNPIPNAEDGPFQGTSLWDYILNAITPKVGPVAQVPLTGLEYGMIETGHGGLAGKYAHNVLGSIAANEPIWMQVFSQRASPTPSCASWPRAWKDTCNRARRPDPSEHSGSRTSRRRSS